MLETQSTRDRMRAFEWAWQGTAFRLDREVFGDEAGEPLLMLPAMSTVSIRDELRALAKRSWDDVP